MTPVKNYLAFFAFIFIAVSCNHQGHEQVRSVSKPITVTPVIVAANATDVADVSSLCDAYNSSITQTFVAKQQQITVLAGRRGLKVTVNPADLETLDGKPVAGDIVVKIMELTTTEDLFKSNAATVSNGSLLVSGGSYFVGMQCNGQELKVKANQAVKMELPKIKENDMELFYGKRDANNNINWQPAQAPFIVSRNYLPYDPPYPNDYKLPRFRSKYKMYDSLTDKVFFMEKRMTIKAMVDYLQEKGVDKNIDSICIPWESFYGREFSLNDKIPYTYVVKKYRILTCKQIEEEKDSIDRIFKGRCERQEANRKYYEEWQRRYEENSVEGQIQKYYAPVGVTSLGWINCDRFYNQPQNTEVPVEIPYTFTKPDVQYFLIYKAFNGLMSGRLVKNANDQYTLSRLPQGQAVTLVAFVKNNGQLYHYKEDFVIQNGKKIKPDFKIISADEMTKMFGANVKI